MVSLCGIIRHVFLPRHSAGYDLTHLVENEVALLRLITNTINNSKDHLPDSTLALFKTWSNLQQSSLLDANDVSKAIKSLQDGQMLALYIREQNCGFMLFNSPHDSYVTLSTFAASKENNMILQGGDIYASYPEKSVKIQFSELLKSTPFAETLKILNETQFPFSMPTSTKSGSNVTETRDVSTTIFVSEWLSGALSDEKSTICTEFPKVVKKIRDEVLFKSILIRRSGFWMTIKVVLQINLQMEFGQTGGKFVYKVLLAKIMGELCHQFNEDKNMDIDLFRQMIAKMSRRLEKLRVYIIDEQMHQKENLMNFYFAVKEYVTFAIKSIRSQMDATFTSICDKHLMEGYQKPLQHVNFQRDIIQSPSILENYIKNRLVQKSTIPAIGNDLKDPNYFLRFRHGNLCPNLNLPDTGEIGNGLILRDIENWIHSQSEYSSQLTVEFLSDLGFAYVNKAKTFYKNDPLGASEMILTHLKLLKLVDQLTVKAYPLLQEYHSGINVSVISELLLPSRIHLERAKDIEDYFINRNNLSTYPGLIGEDIPTMGSFCVRYAQRNHEMGSLREEILRIMNVNIEKKKVELSEARRKIEEWRKQRDRISCSYVTNYDGQFHSSYCNRCCIDRQINNENVTIFERPLPEEIRFQYAVVFELQIPLEVSCLRDMLNLFTSSYFTHSAISKRENWDDHPDVKKFSVRGRQKKTHLCSTTMLFRRSHYQQNLHPDNSDDKFIVNCGCNCIYSGLSGMVSRKIEDDSVKNLSTFLLDLQSPYANLQWAVNSTNHTQNDILAKKADCSQKLQLSEYVEFGSLRAGSRLQIRNIYRSIETNKLSFKSPSVIALILQALWEAGPRNNEWHRESHEDFMDPIFTRKMIELLHSFLNSQEDNWNDTNNLLLIIFIACRILELNSCQGVIKNAVQLLLKCRLVSLKWIADIENVISQSNEISEVNALRTKLVDAASCCSLTFYVSNSKPFAQIFQVINGGVPAEVAWLLSVVKINTNRNCASSSSTSIQRHNLFRIIRSIGITIEWKLNEIRKENNQNLNIFASHVWAGAQTGKFDVWEPHSDPAEQIWYTKVTLEVNVHWIQIDVILGTFLVDGNPVSRLPDMILRNRTYTRVFEDSVLEVQPSHNTFSTIFKYSGCNYFFAINDKNVIIIERDKLGTSCELISHEILENEFPLLLVANYSHWWSGDKNLVLFRPKHFKDSNFHSPEYIEYEFDLKSKLLKETKTGRYFLNINSETFSSITEYFHRLESSKYCHILTSQRNGVISNKGDIELPRMALHFELTENLEFLSREHRGRKVSAQQTIETFVGLQKGLLLIDDYGKNNLILIPHGTLNSEPKDQNQQTVRINIEVLKKPPTFTFEIDEHFQQIKAGKSYVAWFYLANLHALTSLPLPDRFTGMTGCEKALQILQSGRCWSSEPFDENSLEIMLEIRKLTPIRSYYPKQLKCMECVVWPKNVNVFATYEMYSLIIETLITDSLRLKFSSSKMCANVTNNRIKDRELLERAYWRHLCFNPNTKLSETFEKPVEKKYENVAYVAVSPKSLLFMTIDNKRTLSAYASNWKCFVSSPSLHFLLDSKALKGVTQKQFEQHNLIDWLNIDLRDDWLDLYCFARRVSQNHTQSHLRLILSLLEFLGNDVEQLQVILAIAVMDFNDINPPPYRSYENPIQNDFNSDMIDAVFRANEIGDEEYLSRKGFKKDGELSKSQEVQLKQLKSEYDKDSSQQIRNLTRIVEEMWPCWSCNVNIFAVEASQINVNKAAMQVNDLLENWMKNRELKFFLDKVEAKLNLLINCNESLILQPWKVEQYDIPSRKRFQIDYEGKMSLGSSQPHNRQKLISMRSKLLLQTKNQLAMFKNELPTFYLNFLQSLMVPTDEEYLVQSELFPRMILFVLLQKLVDPKTSLNEDLIDFIRLIGVLKSLEMRQSRIEKFRAGGFNTEAALQREVENTPFENWSPKENPEWLLFELEMNLTIRRIQVEVARQMLKPPGDCHSVMQLNMGEGKTAVIVPILASTLSNGQLLCRVTVLKALYRMNFESLRQSLGGLLNRRVYAFPCRRDMKIGAQEASQTLQCYMECRNQKGIVMTLPEYRLSFQLKIYETARTGDIDTSAALMKTYDWLRLNVRDILDESDEILRSKYQLIYTVGAQILPDGGNLRWHIIQQLLKLVPISMKKLWDKYGDTKIEIDIELYNSYDSHIFTPCRLLCADVYRELIDDLADKFLNGETLIQFPEQSVVNRKILKNFLIDTNTSTEDYEQAMKIVADSAYVKNTLLILAGYLKYKILLIVLTKRWRVNYGVHLEGHRKMAVPFKAKDVAAERTEFGHPDVAICFTQLSYYFSGLTKNQLFECFELIEKLPNPDLLYNNWISAIPSDQVDDSVREYNGINLLNIKQRSKLLFPILEKNMNVIDFWLSNSVFVREAKQFEGKMMCTAWDLVSQEQTNIITGFSGTNDTKLSLPLPINQNDLQELEATNEQVRDTLLLPENDNYESLPPNVTGIFILAKLVQKGIRVLLDAGALMLELSNYEAATKWLELQNLIPNNTIKAAVYFDTHDIPMVVDGRNHPCEFELSPFREILDLCVVYLDDSHTRGTDFKFPRGTRACVTLGGGITRDKTVQAAMRMRQLGRGHTVCFFGSLEAENGIRECCQVTGKICSKNVVDWISNNSKIFEKESLVYWSAAGLNYTQKLAAHKLLQLKTGQDIFQELSALCCDKEMFDLMQFYGELKTEEAITTILERSFNSLSKKYDCKSIAELIIYIKNSILVRIKKHIGKKKRFAQLLDEEQEKELEHELEEHRQNHRPGSALPYIPYIDNDIKDLIARGSESLLPALIQKGSICHLPISLAKTTLWPIVQEKCWGTNIFTTNNFNSVIRNVCLTDKVDEFLRPVNWIVSVRFRPDATPDILLLLSPFEANAFLPVFKENLQSTLHMYAARLHSSHDNLINTCQLQYPSKDLLLPHDVDARFQFELTLFAGSTYFGSRNEEENYCHFVGIIPRPRSTKHQKAIEEGKISLSGFVDPQYRSYIYDKPHIGMCSFEQNPDKLVRGISERRHGIFPSSSHVSLIVMESKKSFKNEDPDTDIHLKT